MEAGATRASAAGAASEERWLREAVETLAAIHRPSASRGERVAAEWLATRLRDAGARDARVEREQVHGTFWWPLGLAAASGIVAGLATLAGRRTLGAAIATAAGAGALDDLPPGRRRLRAWLPQRTATTVVAEAGPADADHTVVLAAHHDAAHAGLIYHPAIPERTLGRMPWLLERSNTSPPLMAPVVLVPGLLVAGAATGSRRLTKAGVLLALVAEAVLADIASREAVPGANDNATGVAALLAVARSLAEQPPANVRVIFLSTSEESLCEGMEAFSRRSFPSFPRERTFFLVLDTLGSPHLLVLRGEGMVRMREYPPRSLALLDGLAEELGIALFPNLRLRNATDGIIPLAAGYECAALCSCTDLKQPANYHWPTDVPENVDYGSVMDAARLAEAAVRRLDERWL